MPRKTTKTNTSKTCNRSDRNRLHATPSRVRDKRGRLVSADGTTSKVRWNAPGIRGFANWFKDIKPCILHSDGRYRPIKLTRKQGALLKRIYQTDDAGNFLHSLILNIAPRRHGKTILFCLVILHLFTSRENWTCQLCGNTENHSRRVQFNQLIRITTHTPKLRLLIPDKQITQSEITNPKLGNTIQAMSGMNTAAAYGDKLSVIFVSDYHAAVSTEYFNALQAATLDSEGSLILIDSNADPVDGHVHKLQQEIESGEDPSMFCQHLFYKDLDEFNRLAPEYLNRQKATRIFKTVLPSEARRDILGLRSDALQALFTSEILDLCRSDYQCPVQDVKALTQGRAYKIGCGLDRSKGIFGAATGGDNTVLTTICKVARPNDEPEEIFILDQQVIIPNTSRGVKKAILSANQRYHLDNITLENYEVADLAPWLDDQKIPYELVSAHEANQSISFVEFFRIAREGRFHFPQSLTGLESEMRTFSYKQKANNKFSWGHIQQKFKDDRVYSVNWSIFSLRQQILAPYLLGNIQCLNKSQRRQFCYLMGGQHVLPGCSPQCVAHDQVSEMFKQFKAYQFDSEATIQEFYQSHVRLEGARISQAA